MVKRLGELSMERTPVPLVTFCSTIDPEMGARTETNGVGLLMSPPKTAMRCLLGDGDRPAPCVRNFPPPPSPVVRWRLCQEVLGAGQLLLGKYLIGLCLLIVGKGLSYVRAVNHQQNLAFGDNIPKLGADFHGAPTR